MRMCLDEATFCKHAEKAFFKAILSMVPLKSKPTRTAFKSVIYVIQKSQTTYFTSWFELKGCREGAGRARQRVAQTLNLWFNENNHVFMKHTIKFCFRWISVLGPLCLAGPKPYKDSSWEEWKRKVFHCFGAIDLPFRQIYAFSYLAP